MGSGLKPEDFSGPLKYRHQEDGAEQEGEGRRVQQLSARGTRKPVTQEQRNARLRYTHLKEEDHETLSSLLQGTLQLSQVPRIKSKVIKMFISSTFKDLEVERNILAQQVFPKLRTYCRDKYGVDFQAVDMRWGISPSAKDDHSGEELCLAELAHCQSSSIGPNFALMLGQRYGFCQVPAAIVKSQFDAIRTHLVNSEKDINLLDQCYLRDQNVIPSMYRLQNISKITETTGLPWVEVETILKQLVEDGASLAVKASDLRKDEMRTLMASMTELEVYQGLINIQKQQDRQNNCLVFERQIDDLFEHLDHPLARRFCDVISDGTETDGQAQAALHDLKLTAQRAVPRLNFCSTKVTWTGKGIDPEVHKDHIQLLTDHFYHSTRALVDRNMLRYDQLAADELYHEVVAHWNMVVARCLTFVGREVPLMSIRQYLSQESSQILVVHGESGVGKTSFLAKVTSLVNAWMAGLPNLMKTSLVVRFVGISPKCSTVQQMLYSICHQVAFLTGRPRQEVPEDYKRLKVYFIDLLQRGEVPGRLVILLDSIDQLSSNNGAHKLDWLPARIAPNVKVIVSTLPNKYGILNRLKAKTDHSLLLQLSPLPATDAERIMKVLLDSTSRQVTLPQWRIIQQAFQHCTLPLFITLTFQEAARWRSYDEIPANALQHTIEASINKLLERLEEKHGKTFVSHSLGYITAARRGLSESELEDVLSLDDQVLTSIFTFWLPPIRRIPPSLWPRLYLDIATFLVERDADEVCVLSWYHQQFVDAARARYLSKDNIRVHVYKTLAEYFQGVWSGSAEKPFTYSKPLMARLKLDDDQGKARRFVPDMPLIFRCSEVSERFNLRKMSELPFALLFSYQFDLLRTACFCNYEWLHAKLRATSVQQVLTDFALFDDPETDLVADVLRMSGTTLHQDPDRLGTEISGRLLPHIARYPAIRELVKQCDLAAQMCCPLVPVAQLYAAPGGPLQYECDLEARSAIDVDVFSSPDGILMTAKSYYSTCLKVWELSQGEPRQDVHLPVGQVHPSSDGRYLAILRENRHVSIYDAHTGQIHGHVDYDYGEVGNVARSRKYLTISVDRGFGPIVIDMEAASLVHRFNFLSRAAAISQDEKFLCFNTGPNLLLYSLPLMERKCVSEPCSGIPRILKFAGDNKCFVLTETRMLQSVLFDPVNRGHRTNLILSDLDMRDVTLSHKQNLLLCRCGRWLYLVDAHRERKIYRLQHAPDGVFQMTMTTFSGAGFTPDDRLVVASRHTYLFVWATNSGAPVRVLQAAVSPVAKLFMSPATNKAVTLLEDNTLQVWNLNNLDADVLHANEILKGAVKTLTVSTSAGLVACHRGGQGQAEIKLVDIGTGRVKDTLEQAPSVEHVSAINFSPGGRYLLTWNVCVPGHTLEEEEEENSKMDDNGLLLERRPVEWPILRRIVLWDVERRKPVYSKDNTRFAIFDRHGAGLAVVQCTFYSRFDWTENLYKVLVVPLDSEISGTREVRFPLPDMTELVGCPAQYHDRRNHSWAFIAVLQFCRKTYPRVRGVEGPREFESVIFIQFLPEGGGQKLDTEPKILKLSDLVRYPDENDRIASVRVEASNLLLITYVKNVQHYAFDTSRGLVVPPDVEKGSVLYDLRKEVVVAHRVRVFSPSSDLQHMQTSQCSSLCVDQNLQVFDMVRVKKLCQVEAEWTKASARLALDGHYLLALSADCRSLQVCRSVDGAIKGTVKLQGKGTHLEVAEDGRTIAVGTTDGRVLLFALVLEVSDPYVELIRHLPSRNPPPPPPLLAEGEEARRGSLLDRDTEVIRGRTPELMRLSAKIRSDMHVQLHKRSSFRAISNAVMVAQKVHHARSQACCIQ